MKDKKRWEWQNHFHPAWKHKFALQIICLQLLFISVPRWHFTIPDSFIVPLVLIMLSKKLTKSNILFLWLNWNKLVRMLPENSVRLPQNIFSVSHFSLHPPNVVPLHRTVSGSLHLTLSPFEGAFTAPESPSIHVGLSLGFISFLLCKLFCLSVALHARFPLFSLCSLLKLSFFAGRIW